MSKVQLYQVREVSTRVATSPVQDTSVVVFESHNYAVAAARAEQLHEAGRRVFVKVAN